MTWQIIRSTPQYQIGAAVAYQIIRAPGGPRGPAGPGVTPPDFGTVNIVQPATSAILNLGDLGTTLKLNRERT